MGEVHELRGQLRQEDGHRSGGEVGFLVSKHPTARGHGSQEWRPTTLGRPREAGASRARLGPPKKDDLV